VGELQSNTICHVMKYEQSFKSFTCATLASAVGLLAIGWLAVCLSHAGIVSKRINLS